MSRPIAVASSGYLTGDGALLFSIASDGYLNQTAIPIPPQPEIPTYGFVDSGPIRIFQPYKMQIEREENELMQIIQYITGNIL